MDLSKLSSAPWIVRRPERKRVSLDLAGPAFPAESGETDEEFKALARNAFDVMVRRGWSPHRGHDGLWRACLDCKGSYGPPDPATGSGGWPDPFTALVEAEKWCIEQAKQGANRPAGR